MHEARVPLLELVGITRRFPGVVALSDVSFDLQAGEVHAVVGENGAGKSTLINIISGLLQPDAGEMRFLDRPAAWSSPVEARRHGIVTVHQEAELFPTLSVAENMALEQGLPASRGGWVHWGQVFASARRAVSLMHEAIDVRQPAAHLSVAQRHLTQIAAAIDQRARVLVLDEPTSALTGGETEWLFAQIERLKAAGVGIVYISHRQEEIFRLADRITVLRDGRRVWTGPRQAIDRQGLIRHMVGREQPVLAARAKAQHQSPPRLKLNGLTAADGRFGDISLAVSAGEVLGVYGLIGSGRSECARAVFGLEPPLRGSVSVDGRTKSIANPRQALAAGIAYLPEDRLRQGVFRGLSVRANTVLSALRSLTSGPLASARREQVATNDQIAALAIKCRDASQPIEELSGGNQQKVVLARWLLTHPAVLILDEPTRGVDVGSKAEIHRLLAQLAAAGTAIVLISSDLPEVMENSDRIVVFRQGRIAGQCSAAESTAEGIAALALPEQNTAEQQLSRPRKRAGRFAGSEYALAAAIAILCLVLATTTETFASAGSFSRLFSNSSMWCILALAAATSILAGGIDISLGSLLALSAGIGGLVLKLPYSPGVVIPLAMAAALATGAAGGLLNATLALWGRVHPIVVTLGTMTIFRGLLIALSGGDTITQLPQSFVALSHAERLGVSGATAACAAVVLAMYVWLTKLRSGRHLIALGSSATAARLVGISKPRVWLAAFGCGGSLAALAGMVELSQTGSLQSGMGTGYELQAIAAAVIGGVSISGGRGSVWGVCLGALLLSLIYNALVLWQVSGHHYTLVTGLMLLSAILVDLFWRRGT